MRQGGFTYIGLLLLIAIGGIGLSVVGQAWHTEAQREREKELLFIGEQYAMAIGSYYESTPGAAKQYPASLQDLLEDRRFPVVRRHLRRLYRDPMTGAAEWGALREQARITGVYSLHVGHPLKKSGFLAERSSFADATRYQDWRFSYIPGSVAVAQQPSSGADVSPARSGEVASSGDTSPARADPPASDSSREWACVEQRISDIAACTAHCNKGLPGSECLRCKASIIVRHKACMQGAGLPALTDGG